MDAKKPVTMGFFFVALIGCGTKEKRRTTMEQQEERSLKNYYAKCLLRNKFGLSGDLAEIVSKFMLNLYDKFFENFDPEKAKHYRNAASNLCMSGGPSYNSKIEFYIGLMDKDSQTYRYTIEEAKQKVFEVLGDCTITEATGSYTNRHGKRTIMNTLVATKILKQVPEDYQHNMSYKLKEIFNQRSIINVCDSCEIRYNNESPEDVQYIQNMMEDYNLSWEKAEEAMRAGW